HRRELIEHQDDEHPSVVRPLFCNDVDFSRSSIGSGSHHKFSVALIGDKAKTSQGGHRACTPQSVERNAAHLREIEPVADTQAGLKGGGVRLVDKRPLYVGNDAIVVSVKAE